MIQIQKAKFRENGQFRDTKTYLKVTLLSHLSDLPYINQ